ncbi:FAD-binding oxidoreductase [Roseovarius sp. A21]|uniref:FAD-binding oxidoreductase n=1 Tax=Roseovarius bejariae TaxID=2576383 RepID=A0A844CYL3_9RHOB|nr:FAD-dependent oxidoreductase [Roseovarius bejariae]MRU15720.1 FAD-binding oxidoreductase [Roseovarius bejariae]
MKQVFPPYTYGAGPRAACYWADTVSDPALSTASGPLSCDVAVIGAGFTGLSAALHLAEGGADVVVLDAQSPGWGASGRNGGFCCLGGFGAPDGVIARLHGEAARVEARQTEMAAVETVDSLITRLGLDVDRHSNGETIMGFTPKSLTEFEKEAERVHSDLGITPDIHQNAQLAGLGMSGPFHCGMSIPVGFGLNPAKYALGLARAATDAGARIFSHSPVRRIDHGQGFTLHSDSAQITAKRLIVATNGYSSDDLPEWMRARYLPAQSNVLVTRTLSEEEIAAQGWSTEQMAYDERFFLHYFRLMPNRRFLFGMRGGLFSSPKWDARMHRTIRQHFERMFPAWAHIDTPYSWNGLLSVSRDMTPYCGPIPEMPSAFTALSYQGNGVAMGSHAGTLLADLAQDKTPTPMYPEIMRKPPRRFPLGRLRRAWLWPPYAAAHLTGQ